MKLIIRADDCGFSNVCNIGAFKAVDDGVVTSVEIMPDTPGAEDAMIRMKNYPWLSTGWHSHCLWKPVLDPKSVSTLVDPATGRFKRSIKKCDDLDYDDAVRECRAEMEMFLRFMGKVPDVAGIGNGIFESARKQVCDEYGVLYSVATKFVKDTTVEPLEKYKHLDIVFPLGEMKYFTKYPMSEMWN